MMPVGRVEVRKVPVVNPTRDSVKMKSTSPTPMEEGETNVAQTSTVEQSNKATTRMRNDGLDPMIKTNSE
jgi:hypothetical protein